MKLSFIKNILRVSLVAILTIFIYQIIFWHNDTPRDYIYAVLKILFFGLVFVKLVNIDFIIKKIETRNINIILNITLGLILFLYFYIPIFNHLNFREAGLDLGIYDQAIWKYGHFLGFSNTIDGFWGLNNILGDHFEIILMIISPIYWLYSSVIVLHIFNGFIIVFGCYLLYKLAKLKLGSDEILAKISVMIFLLFPGLQMALMEGQFHPIIYVPILIIAIVYFIEIKKWWPYWISILLLLSIKESMGLYLLFIGIYLIAIDRKYWKMALSTAGIGIAHYIITVREVAILYGGKYRYFNYGRLGNSNLDIIKNIILNPFHAIYVFFSPIGKIQTLALILGSFGLLMISTPLIIAIPMFAERFLSSDEHIWHFYMHYNAPLSGALICAMVFCISKKYKYFSSYSLITFVLISTLLININYRSDIFRFFYHFKSNIIIDSDSRDLNTAIKLIPKNASVSTQNTIVTHFTERDFVYEFPVNRDADYIIASAQKNYWPLSDEEFKKMLQNSIIHGYGIKYIKNHTIVLKKNYQGLTNDIPQSFYNNPGL